MYPEKVSGEVPKNGNTDFDTFFKSRYLAEEVKAFEEFALLGQSQEIPFGQAKSLDEPNATVQVQRFTPLGDTEKAYLGLRTFF